MVKWFIGDRTNSRKTILREQKLKSLRYRANVFYGMVFVSFVSLILRLSYIQVSQGPLFRAQEITTSVQKIPVLPARGRIYDTNGNLLAYDKPTYSVFLTQMQGANQNVNQIAEILAPAFHTSERKIVQIIASQKNYGTMRLFQNISKSQLAFVTEHRSELPGVTVEIDSQRQYPNGDLAGQVLGYVQPITPQDASFYAKKGYLLDQVVGATGIEDQYENLLQGQVGYQITQVNSQDVPTKSLGYDSAPVAGNNLQLTIDGRLQAVTQNEVLKIIQAVNATSRIKIQNAAAVAMNVKTGGILAMVSYPYLDPNWYTTPGLLSRYSRYLSTSGAQMNNVIQNPNYPGSTVKPSSLIAGLTYGAVTPSTEFDSTGVIQVSGQPMKDDAAFGWVNGVQAIAVSSEIFFYQVGLHLGHWVGASITSGGSTGGISYGTWEKQYFIRGLMELFHTEWELGLGPLTAIDLPGEQVGRFFDQNASLPGTPEQSIGDILNIWNSLQTTGSYNTGHAETPTTLAQAATGQMQQFTPIQLVTYTAAIANGGVKVQPHILQAVYPPGIERSLSFQDKPIQTFKPRITQLSFNKSFIQIVQQGMEAETKGAGTAASVFTNAPYTAAGKTGTAQIYVQGHQVDNSVYIVYAPATNPQIAVAVMVPGAGFGAGSAAPIARKMIDTYFMEHHEFYKSSLPTTIPSNWTKTPAYTVPESQ